MDIFSLHRGDAPLLVSLPHDGAFLPQPLAERMTPSARRVPDTDWHVARLYAFARELGASMIVPSHSRYVIDLNRPSDNASLYPGQNTTGLCPVVQFSGEPVYLPGLEPDDADVQSRIERYWRPYHSALRGEIERLHATHGRVVVWEGHSIRSRVPFLFEGRLPDLNLGTVDGASCSPALRQRLARIAADSGHSHVVDGRFKGGYITRHYTDAKAGIETVQLELAQATYMDEDSFAWSEHAASALQPVLREMLHACIG